MVQCGHCSCDLTSAGRFPFCNALSERSFDLFDISGNIIEADGAEYVRQLLAGSPHLREIRVDQMELGEGDVERIVSGAKQCQFTERVSIVGNYRIAHQILPPFITVDMNPPIR
jgi:hypothetical protein